MIRQSHCPQCGRPVDVASLTYSEASGQFICATCRGEPVEAGEPPLPIVTADQQTDDAIAPFTFEPQYTRLPDHRMPTKSAHNWTLVLLLTGAVAITAVAIFIVSRAPAPSDERRQWEQANRDRIIALKNDAEELTIAGRLADAHAKYRELEKMVGGRQISDPKLFELVDQAALDQSRVYMMIMAQMSPGVINPNNGLPPGVEPKQAAPIENAPAETSAPAYPPGFDSLRVEQPSPASEPATSAPATSAPASPTEIAVASEPVSPPATTRTTEPEKATPRVRSVKWQSVTDAEVEEGIRRGVDFLLSHVQDAQLRKTADMADLEHQGLNALVAYSLLQASTAINDPRLGIKGELLPAMIERLKAMPMDLGGVIQPPATYAHSLRASALATYNRPDDRKVMQADVKWLVRAAVNGAYTYDDRTSALEKPRGQIDDGGASVVLVHNGEIRPPPGPPPPLPPPTHGRGPAYKLPRPGYRNQVPGRRYEQPKFQTPFIWDNSNSQYGVLGVWAGAEVGCEVPREYWEAVQRHWMECQFPSGQWSYMPGIDPSYSMTVGGVATLLVTHDYLEAPMLGQRTSSPKPYNDFLTAGLAFLEDGKNALDIMQTPTEMMFLVGYNLFGLERVGLASGLKYFGDYDWYVHLTERVLKLQRPNGSWGAVETGKTTLIDTAYVLLFLSRGRHPVMMNKLRFEGQWTNRPRDLANLSAYASREMERPVNWQAVPIYRNPDDWADSPILYLASNKPVELERSEIDKLRTFVLEGGLLFTHADQGNNAFNTWAAGLAKELFPDLKFEDLSPQHPIYSLSYKIANPRPRLQGVSNGSRLLMVHSPTDLSVAWQQRATETRKAAFQTAINLYLYTTGKEKFRNRLDTRAVPQPPYEPAPQIDLAQVQYDGNFNPEPAAWPRFARKFELLTGSRLFIQPIKPADLDAGKFLIATLTGTDARIPTDADLAPVAKFVRDGGTLFVDCTGGSGKFASAIEGWLKKLEPTASFVPLTSTDGLLRRGPEGTSDLPAEQLRLYAIEQLGTGGTRLKSMTIGKGRVIFTPLDATSGLLGTNTWGILGYLPEYSEALMSNLVLHTSVAQRAASQPASAPPTSP